VEVDEISGTVTVAGRSDASEVTILASKYATAPSEAMGRELLAATEVLVRRNGETLSIETRMPERGLLGSMWPPGVSVWVDYRIEAPESFRAAVKTTSGDIDVSEFAAADAKSISGDVAMRNIRTARAESTSGDVEARGTQRLLVRSVSGDIFVDEAGSADGHTSSGTIDVGSAEDAKLETASGNIRLGTCGSASLTSMSGNLELGTATNAEARTISGGISVGSTASLRAKSISGRVQAGLVDDIESVDVETVSGDVRLSLPPDAEYRVALATRSGRISTGGLTLGDLEFSRERIRGRVGAGTVPVVVGTTSGSILIETR